jgi:hypothetical protein
MIADQGTGEHLRDAKRRIRACGSTVQYVVHTRACVSVDWADSGGTAH